MAERPNTHDRDKGILLQSGTNEVELLEFTLGDQSFGVNVAKIQAIEQYDPERVTKLPMAHPALAGMLLFRERTLPLIDMRKELGVTRSEDPGRKGDEIGGGGRAESRVVLIQEFNNMTTGLLADGVCQIHRVSWVDMHPLAPLIANSGAPFTGSIHIDEREILVVDMERIVADIFPGSFHEEMLASAASIEHENAGERGSVRILLAEDSSVIRKMLTSAFAKGGYHRVQAYSNGKAAYDAICELRSAVPSDSEGRNPLEDNTILVTDIEMPSMDGLALCRNVKEILGLKTLPVVVFSSLINPQMAAKCRSVGADAFISKPEFRKLIWIVDRFCLDGVNPMEELEEQRSMEGSSPAA